MIEQQLPPVGDPDQRSEALDEEVWDGEFPDRPLGSRAYGVTEAEQQHGEGLSRKLRREEPDTEPVEGEEGERELDLLADFDEEGGDLEGSLVADEADHERPTHGGDDRVGRSAEEQAMHLTDGEEEDYGATDRHAVRRDGR